MLAAAASLGGCVSNSVREPEQPPRTAPQPVVEPAVQPELDAREATLPTPVDAGHVPTPAQAEPAPAGSVSDAPTESIDVDPQVRAVLTAYYDDFASGDWARVAKHFWPDATLVTIRSPGLGATPAVVVTRIDDYVHRHLGDGARSAPLRIALESSRIETFGSVASAITHYRAVDPSGSEAQSWRGADLFSLVRHEGEWRIASLVFEGARFAR